MNMTTNIKDIELKVVGTAYSDELDESLYMVSAPYSYYKENLKNYKQVPHSYDNKNKTVAVYMNGQDVVFNRNMNSDDAFRVMEMEATIYAAKNYFKTA